MKLSTGIFTNPNMYMVTMATSLFLSKLLVLLKIIHSVYHGNLGGVFSGVIDDS